MWAFFNRKARRVVHAGNSLAAPCKGGLAQGAGADVYGVGIEREAPAGAKGAVALVGAGPGDPELLTLKALRALLSADIVLFDDLVAPAIVDMARREAEKIPVGKRGYKPSCRQDDIIALMIKLASQGRRVVRLKGGDPMVFGRAAEEIAALRAAGVAFEIVPGVTAALGAAAALQTSLDRTRQGAQAAIHHRPRP